MIIKKMKMFLVFFVSSIALFAPTIFIACSSAKENSSPKKMEKKYWKRSNRKINYKNEEYLVLDNEAKVGKTFGFLDNLFEKDQTAINERLNRRAYGRPFSFRGWTNEIATYSEKLYPDKPFHTSWQKLKKSKIIKPYKSTSSTNGAIFTLLDGLNKSTAYTPIAAVTTNENAGYALNYWQYTSVLNSWGGAAGEGLFQTPPADWINAAHRNGVKILGTFFAPPEVFGGVLSETMDLIKPDSNGKFPLANKMVEIATKNNFDGWVLNFETETGGKNLEFQKNFIKWFDYLVKKSNENKQIIQLYGSASPKEAPDYKSLDQSTKKFVIADQNKVRPSQYLVDYRFAYGQDGSKRDSSVKQDYENLKSWGLSNEQIAKMASYGLEMERNGVNNAAKNVLDKLYAASKTLYGNIDKRHKSSIWSYTYRKMVEAQGVDKEIKYWSSPSQNRDVRFNPLSLTSAAPSETWPSISNLFTEKTVLLERKPFGTSFNIGKSKNTKFYINGKPVNLIQYKNSDSEEYGWTSLSSQDLMPTFRWWTDTYDSGGNKVSGDNQQVAKHPKKIIPTLLQSSSMNNKDENPAYFGATVLKYLGTLDSQNYFDNKLYALDFEMKTNDTFTIVYKGSETPKILLWKNNKKTIVSPENVEENAITKWKTAKYKLETNLGKIDALGLRFKNSKSNSINLEDSLTIGRISYLPANYLPSNKKTNFDFGYSQGAFSSKKLDGARDKTSPGYRVAFDNINNADDVKFYIYSVSKNGSFEEQGIGGSMGIWINRLSRNDEITINGVKYFVLKLDFYKEDNTFKNSQKILIKAL